MYDANGNLTEYVEYEHQGSDVWTQQLKWVYTWNVRDQLTLAMKWDNGADNSGSAAYEYCLSCDSAMSRRFAQYGPTLSRADQLYDSDEGAVRMVGVLVECEWDAVPPNRAGEVE